MSTAALSLSRPSPRVARSLVTHALNFIAITAFILVATGMFIALIAAPAGFGAVTRAFGETTSLIGAAFLAVASVALLFALAAVVVRDRAAAPR